MAVWSRSFALEQNADVPFLLGFATPDPSGNPQLATPYNFTGYTARFAAMQSADPTSPQFFMLTSASNAIVSPLVGAPTTNAWGAMAFGSATNSSISFSTIGWTVPYALTALLPVGEWYADLLIVSGNSLIYMAKGPLIVDATGGR